MVGTFLYFDYDPRDELLYRTLNSRTKTVPLPSPPPSQLIARLSSTHKFVPLKDTDDHDIAYYKTHADRPHEHKPNV